MDSQVPPIIPSPIPPPIPIRKITYQLDRRDLLACRLWVSAHQRFLLGYSLILAVGLPIFINLSFSAPLGVKIATMIVEAFLAICLFAGILVLNHVIFIFVRKNKGVIGTHELEIRDDGLRQRTEVTEVLHRWEGFHKVVPSRGCIFVYTTDNNVEYIPRRAFASEHESKQFEQELITRSMNAKNRG